MKYKHLFGPVVSRRLGLSLGVDLVPYKYCSLNCVYCEVSRTTHLTMKRREFFYPEDITNELDSFLTDKPKLDYITFSGAGEPTLNSSLGEIIKYIKSRYPQYKLALITNSSLLNDPEVCHEILPCDLLLPSLDAVSEEVFDKLNRPYKKLSAQDIVIGLEALRKVYTGLIWLEIFIVPGLNDGLQELELLKSAVTRIRPDRVQLNSLDRPASEEWVQPAAYKGLEEIRVFLQEGIDFPVEIIAKTSQPSLITVSEQDTLAELTGLIKEDEYTKKELAKALHIHVNEVSKLLQFLSSQDRITARRKRKGVYYLWKK